MSDTTAYNIGAVILAAGKATRMGEQKLLMALGDDTLLGRVIECVNSAAIFSEIVVVYSNEAVKALAEQKRLKTVINEQPERGLSSSLKLGIGELSGEIEAFMFFSGDQPFINDAIVMRLVQAYLADKNHIIVPSYSGSRGMPTIFPAKWKNDLMQLEGDAGGRTIIKSHPEEVKTVEIEQLAAGFDIDTKEDYEKALKFKI